MACFVHHDNTASGLSSFREPGVRPHYTPDRVVRIRHATIQLALDPEGARFEGEARLSLSALPTFRGRFALDLDDVEVDSVVDGQGGALSWAHEAGQIVIRAPSVPAEVVVRWHGQDPERGLYFTGPTPHEPGRAPMAWTQCQDEDGHFVFPCHDHPSVKHPWTLELIAPEGYTLLSNGERIDGGAEGGRAWARYEQRQPMPAYLVTFVAARLSVVEAEGAVIPVRYLVPEGSEDRVQRAFGKTPEMIACFEEQLEIPYPWPRYDQVVVHDFVFGGMENVSCTTMTDVLLVDDRAELEGRLDGLVAHELAHQWFGDLVTCQDWSQGWLNESWATYMEAVWWEHSRGPEEAIWYRFTTARGYLEEHDGRYRRPIVSYDFREPIDLFDRHLYNKGSCVLWTLRHTLGDEAFWGGVRRYLERHAHDTVHTRHFQRAMEEVSGTNLDGFFHQWVHRPGHPSLVVRLGTESERISVTIEQQGGAGPPGAEALFELPLLLQIEDEGRVEQVVLQIREASRTYVLPASASAHVRIDPGYRVLAQIRLEGPDTWLQRLTLDPCPVLAVRAARALLASDSRRGRAAVELALSQHPFHGVRGTLAGLLAEIGTEPVRRRLIERLGAEEDPRVRRALATALGRWRTADAADALIALLDEELPTWHLQGAALVALGKTRDPRAVAVIEAHLDTDAWADWIRQRALEGLAATEDPRVLPRLLAYTGVDRSDRARAAAVTALAALADVGEAPLRKVVVDRLLELLPGPGFRTQLAIIAALGQVQDRRALPALGRVHRSAPDGRARRAAFEAMARIQRGRTTEAGLLALRKQLEELVEDNARLRRRLDRLGDG
ncbi:MAG TPA: hypothetical protein ENK18_21160 [Deltaproteobacteria bacterium]|nr:hypothetical protein [Deltaproteobacteria bacterium]